MCKVLMLAIFLIVAFPVRGEEILRTEKLPELVIKGSGEQNLLLIPCMGCRWNEWEEFMTRNLEQYKMYAVTIPGYGGTTAPDLPKNSNGTPWRENTLDALSQLIDDNNLDDLVLVGHSWGTMVTIQLAALRKDVITKVVAIDGKIESTSWIETSEEARIAKANSIFEEWEAKLQSAEEWSKFNGTSVGNTYGKTDSVTTERMLTRIKLISSFMATDRGAMMQYWRENHLIDLTAALHQISAPILNIQSFTGKDQKTKRDKYLKTLKQAKAPSNVQTVFMYDTRHFVMYDRPLQLDSMIANFVNGLPVGDYAPDSSEYFEQ